MKKYLMIAAAALLTVAAPAFADDHGMAAEVEAEAAADAAVDVAVEPVETTLADGTKVVIKGEEVFVVGEDGTETPAPDGEHTLADGTTVTTAGGVIVPAEAAEEAPAEDGHAH